MLRWASPEIEKKQKLPGRSPRSPGNVPLHLTSGMPGWYRKSAGARRTSKVLLQRYKTAHPQALSQQEHVHGKGRSDGAICSSRRGPMSRYMAVDFNHRDSTPRRPARVQYIVPLGPADQHRHRLIEGRAQMSLSGSRNCVDGRRFFEAANISRPRGSTLLTLERRIVFRARCADHHDCRSIVTHKVPDHEVRVERLLRATRATGLRL